MGWVEEAPRARKFTVVATTAVSDLGVLPVLGLGFETINGKQMAVTLMLDVEGLKKFKTSVLRAYDEALREVAVIERSIREQERE